ncbi:ubiquinol-cytochrome c reductase ubiquinone-binding protein [Arctopsyche grandis]|uniref:ubiquinol-cytochrome c reductase ubiquinone-binding protein n=1 Tax=Arctopsyche grandis TaxID=121162 RepID=UPI00406D7F8D
MGHGFGHLATIRGVIYFKLSPYEQKAFTGIMSHSVMNVFRRIRSNIFVVAPPLLAAYALYDWGEAEYVRSIRKNPKDFENDE